MSSIHMQTGSKKVPEPNTFNFLSFAPLDDEQTSERDH